jgi:hypothetical protein
MESIRYQVIVKRGFQKYGKSFTSFADAKFFFFDEFTGGDCTIWKVQNGKYQVVAGYSV